MALFTFIRSKQDPIAEDNKLTKALRLEQYGYGNEVSRREDDVLHLEWASTHRPQKRPKKPQRVDK